MSLYAQALRALGRFLGARRALDLVPSAAAPPSAWPKRSPAGWRCSTTAASTSARRSSPATWRSPGVADFADLDRLTIFADNLVPHVLRCEGVLVYERSLAARIDAGELLPPGGAEREIRACAVHACELISRARACRRGHSTRGCGTAARRRSTRRARGTAAGASSTELRLEALCRVVWAVAIR